jgi:uncharacterized glyoxalase superfamily protein PhnB
MKELNTYLIFNGNCGEAMQFYAKCLGAELQLMKFGDMPEACPEGAPEGTKDRIMHARLTKGKTVLMASDNGPGMSFTKATISPSVSTATAPRKSTSISPRLVTRARLQCPCRRHSGPHASECSRTSLASTGCSTSVRPRRNSRMARFLRVAGQSNPADSFWD